MDQSLVSQSNFRKCPNCNNLTELVNGDCKFVFCRCKVYLLNP